MTFFKANPYKGRRFIAPQPEKHKENIIYTMATYNFSIN